jgi:hypothetical protein
MWRDHSALQEQSPVTVPGVLAGRARLARAQRRGSKAQAQSNQEWAVAEAPHLGRQQPLGA